MLDGFQSVLPNGGDIVISQEAATYRPEMEWIAAQLNDRKPPHLNPLPEGEAEKGAARNSGRVVAAENYEPQDGRAVYRFFELFDLPNIPGIERTLRAAEEGKIKITPPI